MLELHPRGSKLDADPPHTGVKIPRLFTHEGCRLASTPKSNEAFWEAKFGRNVERDRAAVEKLEADGWRVLTVWECETRDREGMAAQLRGFLGESGTYGHRRSCPETANAG